MINFLNVNSFAEAMLYYWGRANDYRTDKRLARAIEHFPDQEAALKKTAQSASAIEKTLDRKLDASEKLLVKFFKSFDNRNFNRPFGFCLASVMVFYPFIKHLDYSLEEMAEYLRRCSKQDGEHAICFGLLDVCEPLVTNYSGIEEISQRVENLSISFENKWKILNAAINYNSHIEELLSLIIPAAKLIENAAGKYHTATEEFGNYLLRDNAKALSEYKFQYYDIINITPIIIDFNSIFWIHEDKDDANLSAADNSDNAPIIINAIIGLACNTITRSSKFKRSDLGKKLKTLSDNSRLEILFYLCSHKAYGQELCRAFNIQHSTLSYHMSKLVTAGLVKEEITGGRTYYSADKEGIQSIIDAFAEKIK